ncbi:hypothetical protein HEN38_022430, partial [Escherichia coli]|nr:hypothetical protein [Escherichia coli]
MFLVSLLRRIAFSYYDYKAYNFNIEKTDFVVIHIPDQIGDAMAAYFHERRSLNNFHRDRVI